MSRQCKGQCEILTDIIRIPHGGGAGGKRLYAQNWKRCVMCGYFIQTQDHRCVCCSKLFRLRSRCSKSHKLEVTN